MTNDYNIDRLIQTVNIPISLYESIEGKYFVGQTKMLSLGDETFAWGGLINPANSKTKLYVNVFTITNYNDNDIFAQVWTNSAPPGDYNISNKVSTTNTTLYPVPTPKAKLAYSTEILDTPKEGTNIFDRIISPRTTVVAEEDGKYIVVPGSSFILFLKSLSFDTQARIALEWWEERYR